MTIEELYRRYKGHILVVCRRYGRSSADAEDIVQTVFLKAWRGLGRFREGAHHYTWLYRITINECLNHIKKHRREMVTFDETIYTGGSNSNLTPAEKKLLWERAMRAVDRSERMILVLYTIEALTMNEIAEVMGISRQGLHKRWQKIRNKLGPGMRGMS